MLASAMVEELRRRTIIMPGITVVERLWVDNLVEAERRALQRLTEGLSGDHPRSRQVVRSGPDVSTI